MPCRVEALPLASRQINALRGKDRDAWLAWLARVKAEGCRALQYRLSGEMVERLCVSHLRNRWRVLVAFESPSSVVVVTVAEHDNRSSANVYDEVYRMFRVVVPEQPRLKPACCGGDGQPPLWGADIDELGARAQSLLRAGRRRR
jgi:hypothetical protein